jgi:putative ATPase
VATAASLAVERIGMPEAQIILAQAAAYVACAPKSNSAVCAIGVAMNVVQNEKTATIPAYLMDAHYKGAAKHGHGLGYQYAHDFENHYVKQQYLPDELKDRKFYILSEMGYETQLKEYLKKIKGEE